MITDEAYITSIADGYATSSIPALVAHRARLLEIARRLEVAQRMADALRTLMATDDEGNTGTASGEDLLAAVHDIAASPIVRRQAAAILNARAALAEWEATR